MMDCIQLFVLLLLACYSDQANAQGVQLMFQGVTVANHGFVLQGQIGTADGDTVMCVTNNTACCSNAESGDGGVGKWFFPNGSSVLSEIAGTQFYRTRGPQVVRLHRRGGGVSGIYRCRIPDASGENQDLYVGLYTSNTGMPMISSIDFDLTLELNAQTPTFTLTCISEGGPVERVDWRRATTGVTALQDGSTYDLSGPTVVDAESVIYHHTLTVTGRLRDMYTCVVTSFRPLSAGGVHLDTMTIDVVAADPPTMVSADQVGTTTTVRVTWTPPTGGTTVTGYRIYYTGGFRDVGNGGATEDTFTLWNGTYTITMVALSQYLPSALSNSVTVTVMGDVPVVAPVITLVQPASSTSITVVWTQQLTEEEDVDSFEIAYERVLGTMQQGPCPSAEESGTVTVSDGTARQQTVMGLEEFSTYSFTITAISNGSTSLPSGSMTATTEQAAPSGAPESVRAVNVTSTSITVAWDPVNCIDWNSEITQYTVRYGPESMPDDREMVTVPGSGDAGGMYTISPLTPFTSYSIQVTAVSSGGQTGEFSDAIIVETEQDVPSRVRNLQSTPHLISIDISWSEPETPNGIITAYEVYYQQQGEQERELRNITDTSMTSTELTGLRPETTYTISVRAHTIAGPGEEESITVTTISISQVQNLEADPGVTSIAVSWSISGGSFGIITAYEVYYQQQGEQERVLGNITDTSMASTELTGLRPETTYTISVRVHSIGGPGVEENVTATTQSISEVQNVGVMSILVSWDSIEGVSYYRVYYSPTGGSSDTQDQPVNEGIVETIMPSAFISNLTMGVEYHFQVAAVVEVDGETFTGERSRLDDSSRVVVGILACSCVTPASGEEQSCICESSSTAAAIAGSVVASVILTVLLYTVILVLVVVVLKWRQSMYKENKIQAPQKPHSTEIPLKECSAYGELSVATPASAADDEGVYEHVQ